MDREIRYRIEILKGTLAWCEEKKGESFARGMESQIKDELNFLNHLINVADPCDVPAWDNTGNRS